MEQRTRRGAWRSNQASVKPHFSSVPNLKLSMRTSAFSISPARIFCPAGTAMLSVSERLLRLTPRKYTASPATKGGPQLRVSSPLSGGSTLMTRHPCRRASWCRGGLPGCGSDRVRGSRRAGHSRSWSCPAHGGRRVEILGAAVEIVFKLAFVAHAEFLEVGLASGEEGVHALEAFLRAPDMGEQLHAVLPRRIKKIGLEVQALFCHAQRLRAMALDGLAPRQRLLAQDRQRHAFVDEADVDRLFRAEAPRAEDHLSRASRSPMMRGRYCVAPTVGQAPTRAPVWPSTAFSEAMTRSHHKASSWPPPMHQPLTMAMTGIGRPRMVMARPFMRSFHMAPVTQVRRFMA